MANKDENIKGIFLSYCTIIVSKQLKREELRDLCRLYGLPFSLRSLKSQMAREICSYWLKNGCIDKIKEIVEVARSHWQERIDKGDRHRPEYYITMREYSDKILNMIREGI